jgi:hypothetical protein
MRGHELNSSSLEKQHLSSYSLPYKILPDFIRLSLIWISQNNNFFTEQGRQPCIQPSTWKPGPCVCVPSERVSQLYSQAPDSLSSVFYDSQGDGRGILTRFHTGNELNYMNRISGP